MGYFQNFNQDKYSLEIETFYKKIKNKVDYIDGADLIANNAIEQVILNGKARDYGLEILDGPLASLHSRVVIILDENGVVKYTEQVPEIADEPNYDVALASL